MGITASDERFALEKTVDAANAKPGDTLSYAVAVTNVGTADSVATTVTDALPHGVSFVAASHGGVYDPGARTVSWAVPVLTRDEAITFEVQATVDAVQADETILNAASIVNPPGYSPPVIGSPCEEDETQSCALTNVPITSMAFTGTGVAWWIVVVAILAVGLGVVAVVVRRRSA